MTRIPLLFLSFLLLTVSVWAGTPLLDQGRAAETAENYQSAIELYRQAMAADSQDPEPARALAELFTAKGLHDLALPVWREVLRRPLAMPRVGSPWPRPSPTSTRTPSP